MTCHSSVPKSLVIPHNKQSQTLLSVAYEFLNGLMPACVCTPTFLSLLSVHASLVFLVKLRTPASTSWMLTPSPCTLAFLHILTQWHNSVFRDYIQMKTPAEKGEFSRVIKII